MGVLDVSRLLVAALALCTLGSGSAAQPRADASRAALRVVLDTDLGPDSDDAGALAVLHALETLGEAEILGVVCSTASPWCAPAADAVNTYYGRPDISVATLKRPGSAGGNDEWPGDSFNGYLAGHFDNDTVHSEYAPDAVALYRQILAEAPDASVAVVVVGPLTNLRDLLASAPDTLSALSGRDLISRKVRALTVMGGRFPAGTESNVQADAAAAQAVAQDWPTAVVFSGYEVGEEVLTGPRLAAETPAGNPVAVAYHLWDLTFARRFTPEFDPETGIWPHSSYDQTAVLAAVRGPESHWAVVRGTARIAGDGENAWTADAAGPHAYLVEATPRDDLARVIEDLMVMPPAP